MFELVTPPLQEPIPLSDLKAVLRISHEEDDALLAQMVSTARTYIERRLDRALIDQTWRLTLASVPDGPLPLRPGIVAAIESVVAATSDGESLDVEDYTFRRGRVSTITLCGDPDWETVTVTFRAGYPGPEEVPADLVRAVYLLTAHYYEERELFRQQRYVSVPHGAETLLAAYREVRL
jgi:uncharacterized phiE125 gp8 family phage protein